jgi:hypothetical protein
MALRIYLYTVNVSSTVLQIMFCSLVGSGVNFWIYQLARRGLLNFRYTVGWLLLGSFGLFAGVVIPVISPLAKFLTITPAALLAIGGTVLLVIICIQLSIGISGLHERQRRLTEELAHLRQTVDTIDREQTR